MTDAHAGIAAEFNRVAPEYETNRLSGWYQAHGEEILQHIAREHPRRILDVGCGTGWLLRQLLDRHPGLEGIGVDCSTGMLETATRYAEKDGCAHLTYLHGDWETMDLARLAAVPIDTIVCASVFHYFANPRLAAQRMFTVLAPGGRVFLLERDKRGSVMTRFWDILHRRFIKDHVLFYEVTELLSLFEDAGFTNVRVLQRIRRFFWQNKLYTNVVLIGADKS